MRRLIARSLLLVCAAGAIVSGSFGSASAAQAPDCSKETALEVARPQFLWGSVLEDPVVQVLCGSFTGPGSVAMAVTFSAPTCWSPQGWAVYRYLDGAWQLALDQPLRFLADDLRAIGGAIRETQPIRRRSDARCTPSGGAHARTWAWDGTRLVAGAWERVTPGRPRVRRGIIFARAPARGTCELIDDGTEEGSLVHCWLGTGRGRAHHVEMDTRGRIDRESHQPLPTGLGGRTPARVTVGRFRCRSQRKGLRCFVIKTGKGFLFAPARSRAKKNPTAPVRFRHFKTPSGNIVCTSRLAGARGGHFVACSIKSGLKPPPPRVRCDGIDFDDRRASLAETGRTRWGGCAGDAGALLLEDRARVLNYGMRWRRGGVRCRSAFKGLTCTNRSSRGFFLSRSRSRRF